MFCLHKTPIWRENSLSFLGGLRSFLPNPQSRFPEGPLSLFKKNFFYKLVTLLMVNLQLSFLPPP